MEAILDRLSAVEAIQTSQDSLAKGGGTRFNWRLPIMEEADRNPRSWVISKWPWVIALLGMILYGATLNRWVSMASLPVVAKVTGWDWSPQVNGPLLHLVTVPFKFLPEASRPVALNVFTAVLAALTLMMLARSVSLLPQDRTRDQRQRERSEHSFLSIPSAWMPPLLAALVCGLQLTFWEHAIAATGEMLDLACFAFCILCVLEHRVGLEQKWMDRLALMLGVSMANNWAMVGFLPLFVAAAVWIRGRAFFDVTFLARTVAFGSVGLLLYLWLPLVATIQKSTPSSFWDLLRIELATQKNILLYFPKSRILLLSLTSLLPLAVIGVRWPSSFGDTSVAGTVLTNLMFRLTHMMFLGTCLWVSFDPKFSPRELGYGFPMLTFYYVGALCVGYFAAYFLLIGSDARGGSRGRRNPSGLAAIAGMATAGLVWLALAGVPAGLVYKNYKTLAAMDGSVLRDYVADVKERIPAKAPVILSDTSSQIQLLSGGFGSGGAGESPVFVDTQALQYGAYQVQLAKRYPDLLPKEWVESIEGGKDVFDQRTLLRIVIHVSSTREVYYLQPSFGGFFESFYLKPDGMFYRLHSYPTNSIAALGLDPVEVSKNLEFWRGRETRLTALADLIERKVPDAVAVGAWYSRSANYFGVEMQKLGGLNEAGQLFKRAVELNGENIAAIRNLRFNEGLRSGNPKSMEASKTEEKLMARYRTVDELLAANGPLDEPQSCLEIGTVFAQGGLSRQAALQFLRVQALDPENMSARFWLGNLYLTAPLPEKTLEIVREIRDRKRTTPLSTADSIELIRLEALAVFGKGDTPGAEKILQEARKEFPREDALLDTLFYLFFGTRRFEKGLESIEEQLRLNPKNLRAILNRGATYIELKDYPKAVAALDQALKLDPGNANALRNRAIAKLKSGELDAAEKDYNELKRMAPDSHVVFFGLGEVASARKDKSAAISHYEKFLELAPAGSPEVVVVEKKLKELKGGL